MTVFLVLIGSCALLAALIALSTYHQRRIERWLAKEGNLVLAAE
ncbi:hypothetical protein [Algicella marina]|nr:hypothetical protein [Algicella marina]